MMKITWLGQAGLLFQTSDCTVMIDPYLSDSVGQINPANHRRVPVEEQYFSLKPDIIMFTHDHLDHYDTADEDHGTLPDKHLAEGSSDGRRKQLCFVQSRHTVDTESSAVHGCPCRTQRSVCHRRDHHRSA